MALTITEALAELKTLDKRLAAKRDAVLAGHVLTRQEGFKDPMTDVGGSREFVRRERQAIADLEARKVAIRMAIQRANQVTPLTVKDTTRTIAEWLTWRKEVAPGVGQFLGQLRGNIAANRQSAIQKGYAVVTGPADAKNLTDLIVNLDEAELVRDIEMLEEVLGMLDGQLSLKNATVTVEV